MLWLWLVVGVVDVDGIVVVADDVWDFVVVVVVVLAVGVVVVGERGVVGDVVVEAVGVVVVVAVERKWSAGVHVNVAVVVVSCVRW